MKFHTPFFIIGFVLIALPMLGIPQLYQDISTMVFGVGLMLLSASANYNRARNKIDMVIQDSDLDEGPSYEEMSEIATKIEDEIDDEVVKEVANEVEKENNN